MTIIVVALIALLAGPLYLLCLLADGRRLREKLRGRQEARASAELEAGSPLIPSDQDAWLPPPYRMRQDTPSAWPPL
jgi:hypothetical protein